MASALAADLLLLPALLRLVRPFVQYAGAAGAGSSPPRPPH